MHPTRKFLTPLALALAATLGAQPNSWIGQAPTAPGRVSSWHDPALWSAGLVPDNALAAAQFFPKYIFSPAGEYVGNEYVVIANDNVTLHSLTYGAPNAYYSSDLHFPQLNLGSLTAGRGTLELAGTGLSLWGYTPSPPEIRLIAGQLIFSGRATVNSPVTNIDVVTAGGGNQVWLRDDSTASRLRLWLEAGSRLDATERASLSNSTATINGGGVAFSGQSTVDSVGFLIPAPSFLHFGDQSTVRYGSFTFNMPGPGVDSIVRFSGQTSVVSGSASSSRDSGVVEFTDQATASSFNLYGVRQLDVTGAATGAGTTGRTRVTTGTPAPTAITADDARTVDLGYVMATDLLLGSNSVRVQGGALSYISDVGGAYRAADGSDLRGGGVIMGGPYSLWLRSTQATTPYAVPLTIEYGWVYTDRQQVGAVRVQPAGNLSLGSGASGSILNEGRVQLNANSYTVRGDYTQTASGSLAIYAWSPAVAPARLVVEGSATLDGRLDGITSSAPFVGTYRHPVLTARSLSGTFAGTPARALSPMLAILTEYTDREVYLVYRQNPFVHAGATASQQALGGHLDATLSGAAGTYQNLLLRLNSIQDPALIAAGLGQLAPDRYGAINEQGFAAAVAHHGLMERRLASLAAAPTARGLAVFAEGYRLENRLAEVDGLVETEFTLDGAAAAAAWRQGRWIVGVSATRDRARGNLDGLGSTARIESTAPGAFARYQAGRFFVQGTASRSSDRYELRRNSGLLNWPAVVTAQPRGTRTDLALSTGFNFGRSSWTVTPFAGVLASHVKLDNFAESTIPGMVGGTELFFRNWSLGSLRSRAGFDAAWAFKQGRVTPRLSVAWLHEFERDRGFSTGLVGAGGAAYRAPGRPAETDLVQASLGLDWRITSRLGLSLHAGLARGRNSDFLSDFAAGLRWQF